MPTHVDAHVSPPRVHASGDALRLRCVRIGVLGVALVLGGGMRPSTIDFFR